MTPEEIAAQITSDININNGLRSNLKILPEKPIRRERRPSIMNEDIEAFMEAERAKCSYAKAPSRISILPPSAYYVPVKTIPRTGHYIKPTKITPPTIPTKSINTLGRRKLDL